MTVMTVYGGRVMTVSTKVKVQIRVEAEDVEVWKEAAHVTRLSLSEWARRVLSSAAADALTRTVGGEGGAGRPDGAVVMADDRRDVAGDGLRLTSGRVDVPSPPSVRSRRARSQMCEHRIQAGSFCKACD